MTDDAAQSAPPPAEPTSAPEPPAPIVPLEPPPSPVESAPVVEQTAPVEPASVIPEESQSTPNTTNDSRSVSQQPSISPPLTHSSSSAASKHSWSTAERTKAVATHARRKEVRLAKVVELAKEKGRITNDDIEKLLHVSDATASRYGTILVQRGLLKREGKGRGVTYSPI
ncbi:DUF977 family protein [Candidatus Kaiserbacteria bacterium]|nr:DUF977 family protein [Candidatus Kaiserbacteria bacterium]